MDATYPLPLITQYLVFGLIGAATLWILLRWLKRPVNIMDLARGAASWILVLLAGQFVGNFMMSFIDIDEDIIVLMTGLLIGVVAAVAIGSSLRLASLTLSKTFIIISGTTWGTGFAMILWIQFRMFQYGEFPDMLGFTNWVLFPVSGIAGTAMLAIGLEKGRGRGLNS